MTPRKRKKKYALDDFRDILRKYQQDTLQDHDDIQKIDDWGFWPRFERALSNQCDDGDATVTRYGLWAREVRDYIVQAMNYLKNGDFEKGEKLIIKAANGLSAFAAVQGIFDPFKDS